MHKAFSILFILFLASLLLSTAGISIFLWSLFILFLIHFQKDIQSLGFKASFAQLKSGLEIPLLFFVAWTFISSLVNVGTSEDLAVCAWEMRFVLGFYFLTYLFKKYLAENDSKMFYTLCGVVILSGAYGLFQTLTGIDIVRGDRVQLALFGQFFRAWGFFKIPLTYAYIISMLGMFCYAQALTRLSDRNKFFWISLLGFILAVIGAAASWTRGAWIALFFATMLVTYIYDKKISLKVFVIFLLTFFVLLINPDFRNRAASITDISDYSSNAERIEIWKSNLEMAHNHPIFGMSWNKFDSLENLQDYYKNSDVKNVQLFDHAHNDFINIARKLGYPGLAAFLWFVLGFLYKNYRGLKTLTDPRTQRLLLWTFGAQIVFYTGSLTQANFTDMEVNHALFFVWAVIQSLTSLNSQR